MPAERLAAKSARGSDVPPSIEEHCLAVEHAATHIFRPGSRWLANWLRFFRVPSDAAPSFLRDLRVAALLHDIGKANGEFQRAVLTYSHDPQTIRHEHLSAQILCLASIREWLDASEAVDTDLVTAAILSHHTKASEVGPLRWCQPRGVTRFRHDFGHPEIFRLFAKVASLLGASPPPSLQDLPVWSDKPGGPWELAFAHGRKLARRFSRALRRDAVRRGRLLATKAALVAADAVGSASARTGLDMATWIEEAAHGAELRAESLRSEIIGPRIVEIERGSKVSFSFRPFQERIVNVGPRALLLSACGSGKTFAAYLWAEEVLKEHRLGRVIFLYPTRGTATEGFRDYVAWAADDKAMLLHGSSTYELEAISENPDDLPSARDKDFRLSPSEERLFALGMWRRRFFSATVDQFLSFLENNYSSLCMLPVLADAAVIIDEVHSFDPRMFSALERFLTTFSGPVLCMTATLPSERRRRLEASGLKIYPGESDRFALKELDRLETHPRYDIKMQGDLPSLLRLAISSYREGLRVLWVVNTVTRCQEMANALEADLGVPVLSYHSRFTLADRQRQHRATVDAFQCPDAPVVAVTTQVCEMSLDLDADVLISELAPIPSLIQRFGRANRHLARGEEFLATIRCYSPPRSAPYTLRDVEVASRFVDEIGQRPVSQRTLTVAMDCMTPRADRSEAAARFVDGGYYAVKGSFRGDDGFTLTAVLDRDLAAIHGAQERHEPFDGYLLPAPRSFLISSDRPSWLPRHIHLVSASNYDVDRGLCSISEPEASA